MSLTKVVLRNFTFDFYGVNIGEGCARAIFSTCEDLPAFDKQVETTKNYHIRLYRKDAIAVMYLSDAYSGSKIGDPNVEPRLCVDKAGFEYIDLLYTVKRLNTTTNRLTTSLSMVNYCAPGFVAVKIVSVMSAFAEIAE